jgi:hypothetical protein
MSLAIFTARHQTLRENDRARRESPGYYRRPASRRCFDNEQRVSSVRQTAEALFKPTIDVPPSSDEPSHRKPRLLPVSPAAPRRTDAEPPASARTNGQVGSECEGGTEIPTSDYKRVRVLAEYGMTLRQIAELYAVSLSEVMRIVRT